MKRRDLRKVPNPWPKVDTTKWNARLIPERLKQLAISGVYYESKLIKNV